MLQRKLREVREFGVLSARSGSWQDVVYTLTTKRLTFILGFLHLPVTLRNFSETRFPGPSPVLQVRPGNQADRSCAYKPGRSQDLDPAGPARPQGPLIPGDATSGRFSPRHQLPPTPGGHPRSAGWQSCGLVTETGLPSWPRADLSTSTCDPATQPQFLHL